MLTKEELAKLDLVCRQSIAEAEKMNTGEIVPVIYKKSDRYLVAHYRLALFTGMTLQLVAFFFLHQHYSFYPHEIPLPPLFAWAFAAFFVGLVIGFFLAYLPFLKRLFLFAFEKKEECRQAAREIFLELNLPRLSNRNGVLIFISEEENYFEILADQGIYSKMPQDYFLNLARDLYHHWGQRHYAAGLSSTISSIGEKLNEHFPRSEARKESDNEFSNSFNKK